jgi:hypothetical protein
MQSPDYGDDSFINIIKERGKYRLAIPLGAHGKK